MICDQCSLEIKEAIICEACDESICKSCSIVVADNVEPGGEMTICRQCYKLDDYESVEEANDNDGQAENLRHKYDIEVRGK